MEDSNAQELFLLEFLVDRVNIPSVQAMQEDVLQVKTCIEFKILHLPPIYICQDTPHDKCTCRGEEPQVFRKGKSCLFALPSRVLQKPVCSFPILMSVYKKLPPTILPDVMTIGTCQIDTSDMLNCLLDEDPSFATVNPCKTLKNNFRITTATGQCVGQVCVFLRFSRLGRKVVTQFQHPRNRKPYLFKGADESPIFQCRKVASQLLDEDALKHCVCEKKPECKEERAPRSCCHADGGAGHKRQHRGSSKGKCSKKSEKATRPCCPGEHKEQRAPLRESQSENHGCLKNKNLFEMPKENETRKCGCEIKEDKSSSCKK